jgi:hypothetical protein
LAALQGAFPLGAICWQASPAANTARRPIRDFAGAKRGKGMLTSCGVAAATIHYDFTKYLVVNSLTDSNSQYGTKRGHADLDYGRRMFFIRTDGCYPHGWLLSAAAHSTNEIVNYAPLKFLILTDFVVLTIWHKRSLTPSRKVRQEKQKPGVLGDLA